MNYFSPKSTFFLWHEVPVSPFFHLQLILHIDHLPYEKLVCITGKNENLFRFFKFTFVAEIASWDVGNMRYLGSGKNKETQSNL